MNKKRLLSSLLAVSLLASLTACGASGDSAGSSGVTDASEVPEVALTDEVNQYGWTVPEETIKITYYACDDDATDQAEEDERLAEVHQIMLDEFNMDITKQIYAQDSTERLNMMLAANDYPDVIVGLTDTMANAFIEQDRAVELTPYLDKYGQDIYATYGDYINLLREEDGSLYKLSSSAGSTTDAMGRDFSIRWDWLQETGLDVPNSFESYYEAIKAIVANHPTTETGEKVYGITAFSQEGAEFYETPLLYMGFYNTATGIYKLNDDGTITHWVDTEEGREVAHYINQFWQDGLIDPDFQTKDYDTSVAFMSNERVAGNIGTWWHNYTGGYQVWMSTSDDYNPEKRMQELTWEETDATPNLISDNYIRTTRVIITDKAEHPEEIVTYWNWQQSPLAIAFNSMGPQGEDMAWVIDEDGNAKIDDRYWYGDPDNSQFLWGDFESKCGSWNYVMANPGYTPVNRKDNPAEGWASPIAAVNMWDLIPNYDEMDKDKLSVDQMMNVYNEETSKTYLTDTTVWNTAFASDSEEATIQQDVKDKLLTDWCLCIMAETDEECDALYDQMVKDLHDIGLDKLVAAQQKALEDNEAKLDGSYWENSAESTEEAAE